MLGGIWDWHQWANDINKCFCETFRHNICPDKLQFGYVCDLAIEPLDPIDGFLFGFICNDFSVVCN
ncbi:DNA cytosine methyltransferase [Bacillaceae bacterium IKA-2]|nr:DNA cytosine methyltransferase [Bacillaceae bacterium IKA-2]